MSRLGILGAVGRLLAARARRRAGLVSPYRRLASWNRLFDRQALAELARERLLLESADLYLHRTIREPRLVGQILFEYGTLLNWRSDWRGLKVLDVGSGRSTLPRWLATEGARVTTFDLPAPVEAAVGGRLGRLDALLAGRPERPPRRVAGSLLALPFADASFDLVTSFSVLEHLDTDLPAGAYVPPPVQEERLGQALDEMVRVVRPGGHLYITSDCCDYRRATADAWRSSYYYQDGPELSGAWPVERVEPLFYDALAQRGCPPVGPVDYAHGRVDGTLRHATFRSPHHSAFTVLARRQG
jgi:SAM-dependent methyltransferase